jgi:hypothetical protein
MAVKDARGGPTARYFRTRGDLEAALGDLLSSRRARTLVGFDFPFGYPAGSGLGGGISVAARLAGLVEDGGDGSNNRFAVAARLNAELNPGGRGPFWGCPARVALDGVPTRARDRTGRRFADFRATDRSLRRSGIQSCWRLYGTGSVGGQALLGLPAVRRLATATGARLWPFDTGWESDLPPLTIAEIWPSLFPLGGREGDVKDARQVLGSCATLAEADRSGRLRTWLARPVGLSAGEIASCGREEGWILGVLVSRPDAS